MAEHNETGILGEQIAEEYLKNKGYQIIAKNYRFMKAEIDIIARDKEEMVFVEVKTRHSHYLVEPEFSVSLKKQRLIISAADHYLVSRNIDCWSRFDIISIILHPEGREIRHLEGAFTAQ
jgi:putative endonuclease